MEWLNEIKKEELPENYQEMLQVLNSAIEKTVGKAMYPAITEDKPIEIIALQCLLDLATHYNKQGFYFSGIDAVISRKKREYVIRNRGRKKVSELARITGFSERTIYDIFEELQRNKQRDLFAAET